MEANSQAAVRCEGLSRRYGEGQAAVDAVDGVSLEFPAGQLTAIVGPSGSGKSTLMHGTRHGSGVARDAPRQGRHRGPARSPARRALGWPAAASGSRASPGLEAGGRVRRRADRQPRLGLAVRNLSVRKFLAILLGVFAAVRPAKRASRLDIVESLQYE